MMDMIVRRGRSLAAVLAMAIGGVLLITGGASAQAPTGQGIDAACTTKGDDRGCIDWNRQVAIAVGMGVPASFATTAGQKNVTALRSARLDAARNLLELMRGVNISSESTLQQAMVSNDTVRTSVEGSLNSIREVGNPKYFSDGSIQVRLEASLRQVIPPDVYLGAPSATDGPQPLGPAQSAPGTTQLNTTGGAYTGLIVDGRGTGVTPAMSPKILDPDGKEVYGSAYVSREFAISQGIVGYVNSVEKARDTDRVKGNPALVKAVESKGANKSDLVISKEDAATLRDLSKTQTFMREARVMIVVD